MDFAFDAYKMNVSFQYTKRRQYRATLLHARIGGLSAKRTIR
jgi:hypothetical protein